MIVFNINKDCRLEKKLCFNLKTSMPHWVNGKLNIKFEIFWYNKSR
jgi:hypothetical protein